MGRIVWKRLGNALASVVRMLHRPHLLRLRADHFQSPILCEILHMPYVLVSELSRGHDSGLRLTPARQLYHVSRHTCRLVFKVRGIVSGKKRTAAYRDKRIFNRGGTIESTLRRSQYAPPGDDRVAWADWKRRYNE